MTSRQREVLADLRAAVNLAHPQALELALDAVRRQPLISGNQPLDQGAIQRWLLPIGEILSRSAVPWSVLERLQRDPLAGMRAIAAVAALQRWLEAEQRALPLLDQAAADRRPEPSQALLLAARPAVREFPRRLFILAERWLRPESPASKRSAAYQLLSLLAETSGDQPLALVDSAPLPASAGEYAALANLLIAVGQSGAGQSVLDRLSDWAQADHHDSWLYCRVLSADWALGYRSQAEHILDTLERFGHQGRQITRTRQALTRKPGE